MEGLLSFPVMQKLNVNGTCFCLIWFRNSTAAIYINESTREQNGCIFHENLEQETFIAEFFLRFRFPAPVCCSPVSLPANVPYLSVLVFLDGCRWSPPMSASANSFPCIKQQRLALCLPFFQDSFVWAVKETFPPWLFLVAGWGNFKHSCTKLMRTVGRMKSGWANGQILPIFFPHILTRTSNFSPQFLKATIFVWCKQNWCHLEVISNLSLNIQVLCWLLLICF